MKKNKAKPTYRSATSRLSSKYQIVIPKAIRDQLNLKEGDELILSSIGNYQAVLAKRKQDPVDALEGLGADLWKKLGGADAYLKKERESWGDR